MKKLHFSDIKPFALSDVIMQFTIGGDDPTLGLVTIGHIKVEPESGPDSRCVHKLIVVTDFTLRIRDALDMSNVGETKTIQPIDGSWTSGRTIEFESPTFMMADDRIIISDADKGESKEKIELQRIRPLNTLIIRTLKDFHGNGRS